MITESELYRINQERRRRGLPVLTRNAAVQAAETARSSDPGIDILGFLIGYATGIPISPTHGISGLSIAGALMHPSPAASDPAPSYNAPEPSAPEPSAPSSYDSGSSSSSYDSGGSSGSYDSGSSSSSFGGSD